LDGDLYFPKALTGGEEGRKGLEKRNCYVKNPTKAHNCSFQVLTKALKL